MIELGGKLLVPFLLGVALMSVSSCAASTSNYSEVPIVRFWENPRALLVEAIWNENERIVLEAIDLFEGKYDGTLDSEFTQAVDFFEETTAILSDTGTLFGRLPTASLRGTLNRWNAWFDENKHTLVLTPSSCLGRAPSIEDTEGARKREQRKPDGLPLSLGPS